LADVNDHFLHSDGDMHSYCIDKEHKSCLNTDEDYKSQFGTDQDQWSMGHAPVLKQTSDVELKDTFFADVNDHFLHNDVDMSRYFTDKDTNPV
jgi:hypothetical protein